MLEHVEAGYGFVYPWQLEGASIIDLLVPWHILDRLQLRPGSSALVQGLQHRSPTEIHIRPKKGTEAVRSPNKPFIASVRFPNVPGALMDFLSQADHDGVHFTSIRTSGVRAESFSDLQFEGGVAPRSMNEFDSAETIARSLFAAATKAGGSVIDSSVIQYKEPRVAKVLTSHYLVDFPVLRGRYGKIRVNLGGLARPLRDKEGRVSVTRVQLDPVRMTISLDLSFANLAAYLLKFEAVELREDAAVTLSLLQTIKRHTSDPPLNLDALDAFEYLTWRPGGANDSEEAATRRIGVIEALLTRGDPVTQDRLLAELQAAVDEKEWAAVTPSIELTYVRDELDRDRRRGVPDDAGCSAFRKVLNNGRYAFLETIGQGVFGEVNKYLDLETGQAVAGKHVTKKSWFDEAEARNLQLLTREQRSSKNVIDLRDHFLDGEYPVLIMGYVEYTLAGHEFNPATELKARRHSTPGSVKEYVEMAIQLLQGLAWLHAAHNQETERVIHSDIKPENIGMVVTGTDVQWKLLDLGVSTRLPVDEDARRTAILGGSPYWMSPQARSGIKAVSNDLYSLGMVLFHVWNHWQHPSRTPARRLKEQVASEVRRYVDFLNSAAGKEPPNFDPTRWNLTSPFTRGAEVETAAIEQLRGIVYKMLAFSLTERYARADDAILDLSNWRTTWGQ